VRNGEATVRAAVESLLAQTFGDFELWAMDDGSTDGTRAVLSALEETDARVRVASTGGVGLVGALALGLSKATGPLIARMDADDVSLPSRFEKSLAALEANPGLAGVGTGVEIVRVDRPPSPNLIAYGRWLSSLTTPERLFADALVESPLCHPSVLLRREPLEAVGGWRDGDFPEDWELWLRLLESGHRLACVPERLHRWTDGDGRLTRTDRRYREQAHVGLRAEVLSRRVGTKPVTVWGAGKGLVLMRALRGRGVAIERLVDLHPRKIGTRIEGIPVVRPDALPPPSDATHLVMAVGAKGARDEIRAFLGGRGWTEGRHFTCAA
jgi:glycosyltransferase involved in cell wall biosynthesis